MGSPSLQVCKGGQDHFEIKIGWIITNYINVNIGQSLFEFVPATTASHLIGKVREKILKEKSPVKASHASSTDLKSLL